MRFGQSSPPWGWIKSGPVRKRRQWKVGQLACPHWGLIRAGLARGRAVSNQPVSLPLIVGREGR